LLTAINDNTAKVVAISLVEGNNSIVAKANTTDGSTDNYASVLISSREKIAENPNYKLKIEYSLGPVLFGKKEAKLTWTSKSNFKFALNRLYEYNVADGLELNVTSNGAVSASVQLQRKFYGTDEDWININKTQFSEFYNPNTIEANLLIANIKLVGSGSTIDGSVAAAEYGTLTTAINKYNTSIITGTAGSGASAPSAPSTANVDYLYDNANEIPLTGGFDAEGKKLTISVKKALDINKPDDLPAILKTVVDLIKKYNDAVIAAGLKGTPVSDSNFVVGIDISSYVNIEPTDVYNVKHSLLYPKYVRGPIGITGTLTPDAVIKIQISAPIGE
jgi:hypothetical protein